MAWDLHVLDEVAQAFKVPLIAQSISKDISAVRERDEKCRVLVHIHRAATEHYYRYSVTALQTALG